MPNSLLPTYIILPSTIIYNNKSDKNKEEDKEEEEDYDSKWEYYKAHALNYYTSLAWPSPPSTLEQGTDLCPPS